MGAGTNVQDRLIASHDLDCPWRPGDLEQRAGRIVRQGNMNSDVYVYRYVTEGTFDSYLWQTVENKQRFISQIMTSKSPVRSCEDVDETALSYAEIKALCAGDPRIREKMDLDVDVARLRLMKADHQSRQYQLEDKLIRYFPAAIDQAKKQIAGFEADLQTLRETPISEKEFIGMEIHGRVIMDRHEAGKALLACCKDAAKERSLDIGHYRGFLMSLSYDSFANHFNLTLHGQMHHSVELGPDARGNMVRLDNCFSAIPTRLAVLRDNLTNLYEQQNAAGKELGKPFQYEEELKTKSERLAFLDAELNMDKGSMSAEERLSKSDRPSIRDQLQIPCRHGQAKNRSKRETEAR